MRKNKVLWIISFLVLFLFSIITVTMNSNVLAEESEDCMLLGFQSYTQPTINEDKTKLYLEWSTEHRMEDLAVNTYLPYDNQYEYSFSVNVKPSKDVSFEYVINDKGEYQYSLSYDISSDQLGTLKLSFTYRIDEIDYHNTIYVATGDVKKNKEISVKNMIYSSLVMILFILIGSCLIIENSRSHRLLPETEEEDENE